MNLTRAAVRRRKKFVTKLLVADPKMRIEDIQEKLRSKYGISMRTELISSCRKNAKRKVVKFTKAKGVTPAEAEEMRRMHVAKYGLNRKIGNHGSQVPKSPTLGVSTEVVTALKAVKKSLLDAGLVGTVHITMRQDSMGVDYDLAPVRSLHGSIALE